MPQGGIIFHRVSVLAGLCLGCSYLLKASEPTMKTARSVTLTCDTATLRFSFPTSSQGRYSKRILPKTSEIDLDAIHSWSSESSGEPWHDLIWIELVYDRFPYLHKLGYMEFSISINKGDSDETNFLDKSKPLTKSEVNLRIIDFGDRFYWLGESPKRQPGMRTNFGEYKIIKVPISRDYMISFLWNYVSGTGEPSDPNWLLRARALTEQIIQSIVWTPKVTTPVR